MAPFHISKGILLLLLVIIVRMPALAEDEVRLSLPALRETASVKSPVGLAFRVEGTVRAVGAGRRFIAVDDGNMTEMLEVMSVPENIRPGQRVLIRGANSAVNRGPMGIRLGSTPVVEIDGMHPPVARSGKVFLREGMREFRVEWFNGNSGGELRLEYECADSGTPVPRQKIPPDLFYHRQPGTEAFAPGLEYSAYTLPFMRMLPAFSSLVPERRGVVPDLDPEVRSRPEMSALVFDGFLKVPVSGTYQFHLTSDDGARLFITDTPVSIEVTGEQQLDLPESALKPGTVDRWATFEGTVTFASELKNRLEMEVSGNSQTFHVMVADRNGLDPVSVLHKRIRVTGIRKNSGILAIDSGQIEVMDENTGEEEVLRRIVEIRQLQPDEAAKPCEVEIQGIVTMVAPKSIVLQDATGGVFIHYLPTGPENVPHVSEMWRIRGRTGPGDFSPVIHVHESQCVGYGLLPRPVQPTRQQLASGSLDAELVEIEGVVTSVGDYDIRLLTRGGNVLVQSDEIYDLPTRLMPVAERTALLGSVVRLRGVYRANWDAVTGSVRSAELMLGNCTMSVDVPALEDPYSSPSVKPSDLLLFTSHPTALKRVRVTGQLLYARPPELFLFDGTSGFRVMMRNSPTLEPGDQVEAAGFVQLGGPSPVLMESLARKTGHSPPPPPVKVEADDLPDPKLDSMRVEVVGTLLSDTMRLDERALEIWAGKNRFVAFLPPGASMPVIERDSIVRLTGVYISATEDRTLSGSDPFEMRLNDLSGITVIKRGPWWTTRHTVGVVAVLSSGLVLAFFWVTLLRRTVAKRSNELAVEIEERELVERHRAMEQERSRMAKDLHDELGAGLTEAGILSSLMRNPAVPADQKDGYLAQLSDLCCTLVTGLDEIVWAVNPRYDSVADLAGYFSLIAQRFLKLAGIHCRLKIDDAITAHHLDSRTRHGIFLAFKEALNNIVRHSGATEVRLTIEVVEGALVISLADNGCGIGETSGLPGSDGLRNMDERIQSLGGTCVIETQSGSGTTVRFRFKLLDKTP
ncbi:MAG: hypothetical protein EOP88_08980 [Verrucomicrobiaceae bacterium]|nr:MAG: hypothetical protein EOP88_08980 [Verrucomicrobiaceae bacterium]